jgi:hypothetical protein
MRALQSLESQTDQDWKCIVIFDGLDKDLKIPTSRQNKIKIVKVKNKVMLV